MKLGTLLVIWKTIVIAVLPRTTISSLLFKSAVVYLNDRHARTPVS